ncbi:hypothetical protein BSM4216_0813 [Bacillus smithii]|nr:hypothetical protein BSM4216_0813 [Bacillus smithii]
MVVPSARFEAYSAFARGSPSNLWLFRFGKFLALFRIAVASFLQRDHPLFAFLVSVKYEQIMILQGRNT